MKYTLTDKLNFEDNPILKVKDKELEIQADAETVLKLMDILQEKGETAASVDAINILFNDKDRKKIKDLKLSFNDYVILINTSISLALGEDPDSEDTLGEE